MPAAPDRMSSVQEAMMFGWLQREAQPQTEQRRKVLDALIDYPVYSPPRWDPESKSSLRADAEYKEFFFDNRLRRIDALRVFLAKFDIAMEFDDAGVMAVSAWFPLYADSLVEGLARDSVADAYREFASPWTDALIGLNAVFDFGIYWGECLLARNSRLYWLPTRGPEIQNVTHFVFGKKTGRRPIDPIYGAYMECGNVQGRRLRARRPRLGDHAANVTKADHLYRLIMAGALP